MMIKYLRQQSPGLLLRQVKKLCMTISHVQIAEILWLKLAPAPDVLSVGFPPVDALNYKEDYYEFQPS